MLESVLLHMGRFLREIWSVVWPLYKVMVPMLLLVKVLELLGVIDWLGWLLAPVTELLGLPASAGLIWATALLTNIYGGMAVFVNLSAFESWSVAQVTVLGLMLLIGHNLPVEGRIAQLAGVRLSYTLLLRIGGGLLLAGLLNQIYQFGGWLQQPAKLFWKPEIADSSLTSWAVAQLQGLGWILLIVAALLLLLKVLKKLHIERLISWMLRPLLRMMGIGRQATSMALIGVTLGLAYGGGLLIREAKAGHLSDSDVFSSITLLGLCHSLIEDTLLILLLGADLSGVLWFRLLLALCVVAVINRLFIWMMKSKRAHWVFLNQKP
ncbi:hypothetical protein [Pelagibaculum spongiae]|nr:hypothetical protein [Pelagibaculum spongiae]